MQLHEFGLKELIEAIKNKQTDPVELTRALLDRVDKFDNKVNGFITVCREKALESAKKAQSGILCGIPGALKDNICTEGIRTTCASKMLENYVPPYSATVAEKLGEQGYVLLGKANMDEFAMGSSTENSYFKKTANPHDLTRIPGGSSGGSAAVVAAGFAPFALGSDTGGSIRQPASMCGVVGMKPTYGTVSRYGVVAFASSLDQVGPIARNVTDCALIFDIISGFDHRDSTSLKIDKPDYLSYIENFNVKGLKIGLPAEYFGQGVDPAVANCVKQAAKKFESLGAVVEECSLPMMEYALAAYHLISSAEASSNLAKFDGVSFGYRAKEFEDFNDMFEKSRSEAFGDDVKRRIMLGSFVLSAGYYDAYYKKAQQVRKLVMDDFARLFNKYDILLTPASPTTAWKLGEKSGMLEMYAADICTVAVNIAGLPALVVPCGKDQNNLPIGLQIIGKLFGEADILGAGRVFEKHSQDLGFGRPVLEGETK